MKLLYITGSAPWPPTSGGALRDFHFISHLQSRHDVRVVVLDEAPVPPPPGIPADVEFWPYLRPGRRPAATKWRMRREALRDAVHPSPQIVREHAPPDLRAAFRSLAGYARACDAVWVSRAHYARHALAAEFGGRLIVDFVDVEWAAQQSHQAHLPRGPYRALARLDTWKLARFERRVAGRAWRCVVCKEEDKGRLGAALSNVYVVPNGTAANSPCSPEAAEPGRLLFVGLMSYGPNRDAAKWFVREVFQAVVSAARPPVLDIVGGDPPEDVVELQGPASRVFVHGFVPDLRTCYDRAAVVVCPIRTGSGTRLKVLEALSYGKAVVATTEAIRGIDLRPGVDCLVADTAAEFATACSRALADGGLRAVLGNSGRDRVLGRYSWDRIRADLDRVLTP